MADPKTNPYMQKNLLKNNRARMAVITDHDDGDIPLVLQARLRRNISTKLDAKREDTYRPGDIESVLESVSKNDYTKNRLFLLKPKGQETGGIQTNDHDSNGHVIEEYDLPATATKTDANEVLPNDGPVYGLRVCEGIEEENLMTIDAEIQVEPAHENNIFKAEIYANTTASVFVGPGNEGNLGNNHKFHTLLGKVPNLAKHLRQFDRRLIAPGLQNKYVDVVDGENSLGFFPKEIDKSTVQIPYLVQKCVHIEKNEQGGNDYFFQFIETYAALRESLWFTFPISYKLSQFESTAMCCVAFLAFLEYHGFAPVHGIECAMHTRIKLENAAWNDNIGYFRVTQSGIGFTEWEKVDAVTLNYGYRLENGWYPFFKSNDEKPELEEANLEKDLLVVNDAIAGNFLELQKEDRIRMIEKLQNILLEFSSNGEDEMTSRDVADASDFLDEV